MNNENLSLKIIDNPRFLLTIMINYFFIINTELTRSIDDMNIKKGRIINYVLIEPQVTKITKERILGIYH